MKAWIVQTLFISALLLIACVLLPRATYAIAYIIDNALPFAVVMLLALLFTKRGLSAAWATHIQLRGVGGKSNYQATKRDKK